MRWKTTRMKTKTRTEAGKMKGAEMEVDQRTEKRTRNRVNAEQGERHATEEYYLDFTSS